MYTSNQQVFDIAARHLLTQKQRSATPRPGSKDRCLYRAPDGCKCAVGALIPDDIYEPGMDDGDSGIALLHSRFPVIRELFANVSLNLLSDLQDIHDDTHPSQWAQSLRAHARLHNLSAAVVEELDQ